MVSVESPLMFLYLRWHLASWFMSFCIYVMLLKYFDLYLGQVKGIQGQRNICPSHGYAAIVTLTLFVLFQVYLCGYLKFLSFATDLCNSGSLYGNYHLLVNLLS